MDRKIWFLFLLKMKNISNKYNHRINAGECVLAFSDPIGWPKPDKCGRENWQKCDVAIILLYVQRARHNLSHENITLDPMFCLSVACVKCVRCVLYCLAITSIWWQRQRQQKLNAREKYPGVLLLAKSYVIALRTNLTAKWFPFFIAINIKKRTRLSFALCTLAFMR